MNNGTSYIETAKVQESPLGYVSQRQRQRKGERARPMEMGWWSPVYPLMSGAAEVKLLIIPSSTEMTKAVSASIRLNWPGVTLVSALGETEAIVAVETEAPDIIIVDLDLPGTDALDLLRRIRLVSNEPIIALTYGERKMRGVRALEMGADEYLRKPFKPIELLASAKALLRRTIISGLRGEVSPLSGNQGLVISAPTHEVRISGTAMKLTGTEFDLLSYLVKHEGWVIPHRTLIEDVWGSGYNKDDMHVLRVNISRLRRKLSSVGLRSQVITSVWGVGYKFTMPKP